MGEKDKFDPQLIEYLDARYKGMFVQRDTCSSRHEKLDERFDSMQTLLTQVSTKLEISNKFLVAILLTCLTAIAAAFMDLIIK